MSEIINIYCDESCHLENDRQKAMVLGAISCPSEKRLNIAIRLREIKKTHGLPADFEIKWTKVSPAGLEFYLAIVDYFFDDADLTFRAVVATKGGLKHEVYSQNHDTWYYKMYYLLLNRMIDPNQIFNIYLDIKDTKSEHKVRKLHDVLCNANYDFDHDIIRHIQQIRSHESEQIQLADLLIGAVSHASRNIKGSPAKQEIIRRVRKRSGYSLKKSTLVLEHKFNLLCWKPQNS